MSADQLLVRARGLWETLAAGPVSLAPSGGVTVVVSPESGLAELLGPATLGYVSSDGFRPAGADAAIEDLAPGHQE
ncbi:hypothetical protein ACIRD8_11470 [Streptomyces sp. NPDC102451]|uniref:hypothetical protein n=1 Tax=Streptomyces sp. NPDC102451 TaxID=3366177 RepID=UPI0038063510